MNATEAIVPLQAPVVSAGSVGQQSRNLATPQDKNYPIEFLNGLAKELYNSDTFGDLTKNQKKYVKTEAAVRVKTDASTIAKTDMAVAKTFTVKEASNEIAPQVQQNLVAQKVEADARKAEENEVVGAVGLQPTPQKAVAKQSEAVDVHIQNVKANYTNANVCLNKVIDELDHRIKDNLGSDKAACACLADQMILLREDPSNCKALGKIVDIINDFAEAFKRVKNPQVLPEVKLTEYKTDDAQVLDRIKVGTLDDVKEYKRLLSFAKERLSVLRNSEFKKQNLYRQLTTAYGILISDPEIVNEKTKADLTYAYAFNLLESVVKQLPEPSFNAQRTKSMTQIIFERATAFVGQIAQEWNELNDAQELDKATFDTKLLTFEERASTAQRLIGEIDAKVLEAKELLSNAYYLKTIKGTRRTVLTLGLVHEQSLIFRESQAKSDEERLKADILQLNKQSHKVRDNMTTYETELSKHNLKLGTPGYLTTTPYKQFKAWSDPSRLEPIQPVTQEG